MGVLTRGGFRRRLILLAAALALGIASVIILPIGSSEAVVPVEEDAGVLLLHVDSDGDSWVRYYPDADPSSDFLGEWSQQQEIQISNKCAVTTNGSLLMISQSGGTRGVGAVSNGLGARNKNNCSTGQGRLNADQSVTFTVVGTTGLPADTFIKSVEADVEGKFGADLGYSLDGTGSFTLFELPITSDNGPDAGGADNNAALIEPSSHFSSITFKPIGGEIAIEGGSDGGVPRDALRDSLNVDETVFELVTVTEYDGIIACGETTDPVGDGTTTALATLTRGDDNVLGKPGGGECDVEIGYNLSSSTAGSVQTISFEFEEEELPSWFGSFTWAPETAVVPVPATQVDVDGDGPGGDADLEWCAGVSGGIPILPSDESWCLVEQQSVLLDGGLMQVTQQVYGLTDPFWARG